MKLITASCHRCVTVPNPYLHLCCFSGGIKQIICHRDAMVTTYKPSKPIIMLVNCTGKLYVTCMIEACHTSSGCGGGQPVLILVLFVDRNELHHPSSGCGGDEEEDDDGFFNRKKTVSSGSVLLSEYLCSSQMDVAMIRTWPCLSKPTWLCQRVLRVNAILVPNRARISDAQFEHQLLLKLNRAFMNGTRVQTVMNGNAMFWLHLCL